MSLRFAVVTLLVLTFAVQISAQTTEQPFTVIPEVQFCTGGRIPLLMDLFIPTRHDQTPTPAVLFTLRAVRLRK